ncbi:aminotransferase class I/II-fold pyridoxal phosphate-dependent enzyme [Sinobaca sp. H24]|uniref:aminotransferase class I/II-fold pyridoxal phosphate-dependent enzyme n=1 Tax=Sinobaca sp. H24 TaxID=2923376 RepID=UPI00207998A6|nr:PLP-dependent aminotransferase family protein [Sinobaca sp. H24]
MEDDYDAEFKYEGDPIPALHSLDDLKRVIYVGTFSKSLLPGLRLSYMVLPPALLAVYKHQASHLMQTSSSLIQLALYVFIKSGEYQKHIKRMSKHYKTIRAELIEALYDTFGSSISITGEKAGLHFLMEINTPRPTGAILEKAKEHRLELYGMDRFWLKETAPAEDRPVIIIGFARLRSQDIASAVSLLYRCCFGRA